MSPDHLRREIVEVPLHQNGRDVRVRLCHVAHDPPYARLYEPLAFVHQFRNRRRDERMERLIVRHRPERHDCRTTLPEIVGVSPSGDSFGYPSPAEADQRTQHSHAEPVAC